jgi:hypothetical protein
MGAAIHKLKLPENDTAKSERVAKAMAEARAHIAGKSVAEPVKRREVAVGRRLVRSTRGRAAESATTSVQQSSAETSSWAEWVDGQIRAAVEREHEFMIDVVGGVIAQEQRRVQSEMETKVKTLEAEIATLRGLLRERVGEIAEKSGKSYLELGQRLTEIEKNAVGMKVQIDMAEKMSTEAATFFRKMFTGS